MYASGFQLRQIQSCHQRIPRSATPRLHGFSERRIHADQEKQRCHKNHDGRGGVLPCALKPQALLCCHLFVIVVVVFSPSPMPAVVAMAIIFVDRHSLHGPSLVRRYTPASVRPHLALRPGVAWLRGRASVILNYAQRSAAVPAASRWSGCVQLYIRPFVRGVSPAAHWVGAGVVRAQVVGNLRASSAAGRRQPTARHAELGHLR